MKALAQRGWVKIERSSAKEPAIVSLTLETDAVLDALVELRGAEKHRAVLEALQAQDGAAWIGRVYAETGATLDTLRDLEAAGLVTVAEEMVWRDPLAGYEFTLDKPLVLTADQERVWGVIRQRIEADKRISESANRRIGESENQRISKSANQRIGESENQRISESANLGTTNQQIGNDESASGETVADGSRITDHASRTTDHASRTTDHAIFLLHGVTGSGKTEIYLHAIAEVLKQGRQAVVLVPEIALTPQTIRRFSARFPGKVTVWHSELSDGERFDVWRRVRTNHPAAQVVVGSRSALFLPFPELGVIVLDEEHEPSYKQERTPRYHARTTAIKLGQLTAAPVILGSATPALETYFAARRGEITLLTLPKRILGRHGDTETGGHGDTEVGGHGGHGDGGTRRHGDTRRRRHRRVAASRVSPSPRRQPKTGPICRRSTSSICGRSCARTTGACSAGRWRRGCGTC